MCRLDKKLIRHGIALYVFRLKHEITAAAEEKLRAGDSSVRNWDKLFYDTIQLKIEKASDFLKHNIEDPPFWI